MLTTRIRSLTSFEIAVVLVLVVIVLVVYAMHGSIIWRQQQQLTTMCSLLVQAWKAQSEGVQVYIGKTTVTWQNDTLITTLNVQPPNPCTEVDTTFETLKSEAEVHITAVVNVSKPPPGTVCIQVLPPPTRYNVTIPLEEKTGYKVTMYARFVSANKPLVEKPILRAVVACTKNNPTIKDILDKPQEYKGKTVTLNAIYTGWQPPQNLQGPSITTPPVTRSDWTIADSTAWIYVAANSPAKPSLDPIQDWGTPLTIVGKIETANINGIIVPYIIVLDILK